MEEFYGAHAPCFNVWRLHALIAAICVVTIVRIAATHPVFSSTYDEPLHA